MTAIELTEGDRDKVEAMLNSGQVRKIVEKRKNEVEKMELKEILNKKEMKEVKAFIKK
jgi:hypothetical protein